MLATTWMTVGIVLGVAGVIMLFAFGMPYRLRMGGNDIVVVPSKNSKEARVDTVYTVLGYVGLLLIIAGAVCQIVGIYS